MAHINLTNQDDDYEATVTASSTIDARGGDDIVSIFTQSPPSQDFDDRVDTIIHGGSGDDSLSLDGTFSHGAIYGEDGNDTIFFYSGAYGDESHGTVYGGAGNDHIVAAGTAYGDAGDDYVEGYDVAYGGDGADHVGGGHDAIGGDGDDVVNGGDGASGGRGSDEVSSHDPISGGAGNDVLISSTYADGNAGHDVFVSFLPVDGSVDMIADDFETGVDRFAANVPLTVVHAFTGAGHEVLATDSGAGQGYHGGFDIDLDGDKVADTALYINTAYTITQSDLLYASHLTGDADDVSKGDATAELMLGHDGNDVLSGAGGDDWLFGGFGADQVSGGTGNDLLVGNSGNDTLDGGIGNDDFDGGEGTDTMYGRDGDDVIDGGYGKDVMSGGAGADTFVFHSGDSGLGSANRDVIKDFEVGIDQIDLRGIVGHEFVANGPDKVFLLLDADGDGKYEMQVNVAFMGHGGASAFSDADLILT